MNGEHNEAGYVLFDVLIGMAIAGLVMLIAVMGFRQIHSVQSRLRVEAAIRAETIAVIRLVRSQLEDIQPGSRPSLQRDQNTGNMMLAFSGTLPGQALANPAIDIRVRTLDSMTGKGGLLVELQRPDIGLRSTRLFKDQATITFDEIEKDRTGQFPDFTLVITPKEETARISMPFSSLRKAHALCIAAPFEPSCRN